LSLTAHILINNIQYDNPVAQIYENGELILEDTLSVQKKILLDKSAVVIRDGKIGVISADCPTQICVNMGFINGAVPIICVPNQLEIRIVNHEIDVDGVTR
jgi:hypothetical protein